MDKDPQLTSRQLATLIVDALIDADVIKKSQAQRAIDITEEEIEARKAAGDY